MVTPATEAVARRTFLDGKVRTLSFAALFVFYAYASVVGYRDAYPTRADRIAFARSFGTNKAVTLFYGVPHDLLTAGGYAAWRVGGFGCIIAGLWGMLAAVRALRAEEDAGRAELVLAGALARRGWYGAGLAGAGAGGVVLWLALFAGLVAAHLPAGGSAYLALATVSPVPVFLGIGALASQLAPTRRVALELSGAVLVGAFLVRVVADTAAGFGWLRWATPFGWVEEMRAFADPVPAVLLLPAVTTVVLVAVAGRLAARRDVGTGLLPARDTARPRYGLLGSPTQLAARESAGSLTAWIVGTAVYALVIGLLSTSFTTQNISASLRKEIEKLGGASITTPAGALGFYFVFFVLVVSLFMCAQVAAMRREEAEQRLETVLAFPVSRTRWLLGRVALALAGAAAVALTASLFAWAGSASRHAHVPLARLLEAGLNCLPTAALFLGLGTLAFAAVPRASVGIAYGLVAVAYVWNLVGSLLSVPHWLVELTPFAHVALVPAQSFDVRGALVMLAGGCVAAVAAVVVFDRRDLQV